VTAEATQPRREDGIREEKMLRVGPAFFAMQDDPYDFAKTERDYADQGINGLPYGTMRVKRNPVILSSV